MKKTEVLFFFDTEDFTSERAAEGILREAQMLTEEGVRGQFNMVGLLCDALKEWGRQDVIDALSKHNIGIHTYGHTLHPDLCEQSDREDFDEAYREVASYEDRAFAKLRATFPGKKFSFACPPGNNDSYVGMYYYADHGVLFDAGSYIHTANSAPVCYCNLEHIRYDTAFEDIMWGKKPLSEILDEFAERERVVVYTHPNLAVKTEFWDKLNFAGANLHEKGSYVEAPDRPKEEQEWIYAQMRKIVRAFRDDERFYVTDVEEIAARKTCRPAIRRDDIPALREKMRERIAPVGLWSVADVFLACLAFLRGEAEYLPGRTYGFLSAPVGIGEETTVSAMEVTAAARDTDARRFLPPCVRCGEKTLGTGDFLIAMLDVLCGIKTVSLSPREQNVPLDDYPDLVKFRLQNTWLHSPDLKDEYLSERLRLQNWTLRPVKRT